MVGFLSAVRGMCVCTVQARVHPACNSQHAANAGPPERVQCGHNPRGRTWASPTPQTRACMRTRNPRAQPAIITHRIGLHSLRPAPAAAPDAVCTAVHDAATPQYPAAAAAPQHLCC